MARFENRTYFKANEFTEPDKMSDHLVSLLEIARGHAGVPFSITSSFRDGDGDSTHDHGLGVDIDTEGSRDRFAIVAALLSAGFTRLGIYYSEHGGHVHADIGDTVDPSKWVPNVVWVGKSR